MAFRTLFLIVAVFVSAVSAFQPALHPLALSAHAPTQRYMPLLAAPRIKGPATMGKRQSREEEDGGMVNFLFLVAALGGGTILFIVLAMMATAPPAGCVGDCL